MCLYANKDNPKKGKVRIKFDKKGYAKCWKSYENGATKLFSNRKPGLYSPVYNRHQVISHGEIESDRTTIIAGADECDAILSKEIKISRGIHVFTRIENAKIYSEKYPKDKVVQVQCHKSDLVAVSAVYPEAVFMKVSLSKEEYDKAIKE